MTEIAQAFLGKYFAEEYPYNMKIDNFAEVEEIENLMISSLRDEEILGQVRPVGVLQLYNRVASDIF